MKTAQNGLGTISLLIAIIALMTVWSVIGGIIFGAVAVAIGSPPAGMSSGAKPLITA